MAGHVKARSYKNPDGSTRKVWRARLPDPTRGGANKIERQFPTKREAQQWLTSQQGAVQRGEWIDPAHGKKTFSVVADEWRATWDDLRIRTRHGYELILGKLEERFGEAQIAALRTDALQAYANELRATRSPSTVHRYFTVLSGVMRLAVEYGYIASNPCASVRLPKQDAKTEQLFLTPDEVVALAEGIDTHYRVAIYTAAYCGLRAGELWALRRDDIDLLHGTLRVDEALKDVGGRLEFGQPKTAASMRTISLPGAIRALLEEHLAVATKAGSGPDALVFTTPSGLPVRHGNFARRVFRPTVRRGVCSECGSDADAETDRCPDCGGEIRSILPPEKHGLRFHDLRHTCASLSLAVAPNLHIVMKRLGHTSITTTVDTYGHLVPSVDSALADGLDRLFADAAPSVHRAASLAERGVNLRAGVEEAGLEKRAEPLLTMGRGGQAG